MLDEPTSNLDVRYQVEVMETIHGIVHEKGHSSIAVIHNLDLLMRFCDKIVLLDQGQVRAAGKVEDILSSELIKEVFGVDTIVDNTYTRNRNGNPLMLTMRFFCAYDLSVGFYILGKDMGVR